MMKKTFFTLFLSIGLPSFALAATTGSDSVRPLSPKLSPPPAARSYVLATGTTDNLSTGMGPVTLKVVPLRFCDPGYTPVAQITASNPAGRAALDLPGSDNQLVYAATIDWTNSKLSEIPGVGYSVRAKSFLSNPKKGTAVPMGMNWTIYCILQ